MLTPEEEQFISIGPFVTPTLFDVHLATDIKPYLNNARKILAPKGYVFLEPGQKPEHLYFITKGIVGETYTNLNGLEKLSLYFPCYPIALFGCIHKQPVLYTSVAYTSVEAYAFTYQELLDMMQTNRHLLENIMRLFALECRNSNSIILQNHSCSCSEKIYQAIFFYTLTAQHFPPLQTLKLTQHLLSELAGVHRTSVGNTIKELKADGLLKITKAGMTVTDLEELKLMAFHSIC